MANKRDLYEVLGIGKSASEAEMKAAYRKLARQHHPDVDKSPGSEERFKEISQAYQVLSDPQKRAAYDRFGHSAFEAGGAAGGGFGASGYNPFGGGFKTYSYSSGGNPNIEFDFGDFQDPFSLFEQFFGGSGFGDVFRRRPSFQLTLSFDEAIKGVSKEIEVETRDKSSKPHRQRMTIKVPAGVENGTKMRFGEMDIVFRVHPHPEFERQGADILTEITLTAPQLVLGDVIEVNTVEGEVKVKVPPSTEPGTLIKIKGKGVPNLRGGKGDHYIRVKIAMPKNLSAKEKELYEELKTLQSKKKGWF